MVHRMPLVSFFMSEACDARALAVVCASLFLPVTTLACRVLALWAKLAASVATFLADCRKMK